MNKIKNDTLAFFLKSPVVLLATLLIVLLCGLALLAPWVAPHDPFDAYSLNLMDAFTPPVWNEGGHPNFLLGTDDQGRDLYSAIIYGLRLSLLIGFAAVALAMIVGVGLGLLAGMAGGWTETIIMRLADIQFTFPAILVAFLVNGVARTVIPRDSIDQLAIPVLIIVIALSDWPQFARLARSSTLVQKSQDYVAAARINGAPSTTIALRHILPNILGPVLVVATISLALAIITEATLSFLGVGVPPTTPSLGTLIRIGNDFLFSGEWWISFFPAMTLVLLSLSVNLLGDWLRDAFNPKLN